MENKEHSKFLSDKYPGFHMKPEVRQAAKNVESKTGNKIPNEPSKLIDVYLKRIERLILDPNKVQDRKRMGDKENTDRPRALAMLREMVMNKYVRPNKAKMAENAARVEGVAAGALGLGPQQHNEEQLALRGNIAIEDVESSLDQWITYLSDPNEPYPTWFRYYAFRNILNLSEYDKDKGEFPERSAGTIRLFPDIDRGALAYIQDIIEASQDSEALERLRKAQVELDTPSDQLLTKQKAQVFAKLSFAKQYAQAMEQAGEITPEMRAETKGEWVTYPQGSDPTGLWKSLQNKGTAWCTKGFGTAKTQLEGGDFHVYYTLDKKGNPTIPRIAIRMQEGKIFEARGVADTKQNIEGNMGDIAKEKIDTLPGAEKYRTATEHMKQMTALYEKSFKVDKKTGEKTYLSPQLSKDELTFLYEINAPIEGFGYQKDPRIAELRKVRNTEEDMPIAFGCSKEQIAHSLKEIVKNAKGNIKTMAYVGQLEPGIFQKFPENLEHIYISFPENKIRRKHIEIGGKTAKELLSELQEANINISEEAKFILKSKEFVPTKNREVATFIRLTVSDLGFKTNAKIDQIYERAQDLGLELCSSDTGPNFRLQYQNQPMDEWLNIAMKQITVSDGRPFVFFLRHDVDGLSLRNSFAKLGGEWGPADEFIFRFRKSKT